MICNPSTAQFRAVIDASDNSQCINSQDYTKNTCRNVVTLNEILKGTGKPATGVDFLDQGDSAAMREKCLVDVGVTDIRTWSSDIEYNDRCKMSDANFPANAKTAYKKDGTCYATECTTGYMLEDGKCTKAETDCKSEIPHAAKAVRKLNGTTWGGCELVSCEENYRPSGDECVADKINCSDEALKALNAADGTRTWNGTEWGNCVPTSCATGYDWNSTETSCIPIECETGEHLEGNDCVSNTRDCPKEVLETANAISGNQTWNGNTWGECVATDCEYPYESVSGKCKLPAGYDEETFKPNPDEDLK